MRDDLVGFLVGALDASEHDELAQKLDKDQQLQQELKLVERGLSHYGGIRLRSNHLKGLLVALVK